MTKDQQDNTKLFIDTLIPELARGRDIVSLGEVVVQIGSKILGAEGCSLYLVVGNAVELTHSTYLSKTDYIGRRKPISSEPKAGLTSWVAATGKFLEFSNSKYRTHPAWAGEEGHLQFLPSKSTKSLLITPVKDTNGNVIGVISFENKMTPNGITNFGEDDKERLINLANAFAKALESMGIDEATRYWDKHTGLEDDLHDLVNWYQFGVVLWIDAIDEWLKRGDIDKAKELMPQLLSQAHSTVYELKTIHTNLMSGALEANTLSEALSSTVNAWNKRVTPKYDAAMKIKLSCPKDLYVPYAVRSKLVRIASLACSNAIRHSGIIDDPKINVGIKVERKKNRLTLNIIDNGHGAKKLTEGYGIARMKQLTNQLNLFGGGKAKLVITSALNKGTKVSLTVDLQEKRLINSSLDK